jgi:hypothetical protein
MRLSEVLGFRCFLLVYSTSLVLFFLWRRWTSPLLSLIVSQRVIWKIKAIFFSGKICHQFHRLTTHLKRRASSVMRGQIVDCSRLLHAAHSHPLYTTTITTIHSSALSFVTDSRFCVDAAAANAKSFDCYHCCCLFWLWGKASILLHFPLSPIPCSVIPCELFLRPEFSRFVLFLAIVLSQILLQLQKKT